MGKHVNVTGCLRKRRWRTDRAAQAAAKHAKRKYKADSHVYYCTQCLGFHLTTQPLAPILKLAPAPEPELTPEQLKQRITELEDHATQLTKNNKHKQGMIVGHSVKSQKQKARINQLEIENNTYLVMIQEQHATILKLETRLEIALALPQPEGH